jgi:hypothetical protein
MTMPHVSVAAPKLASRLSHWTFVPLLGTLLFVALLPPNTVEQIQHLEHHGGATTRERFDVGVGLINTGRSMVDNLLLGMVGISTVEVPKRWTPAILVGVAAALAWWWRSAPSRGLILLGLGTIVAAYVLVYSARASFNYDGNMTRPNWSRYHLLPQLGLAFVVAGGMPTRAGREFTSTRAERLTRTQASAVMWMVAILFVIHLPRALLGAPVPAPGLERLASADAANDLRQRRQDHDKQAQVLRSVAETDDRCREHRIGAADAVDALEPVPIPLWFTRDANALKLLRGSDDPLPRSADEVRELLNPP